jgi:Domain of unknown function (DUF6434)
MAFDWHSSEITRQTPLTKSYRNTQNVRRFFKAECGDDFKFDRAFMAWLKTAVGRTMGDAADEWLRRQAAKP